jgi:hypothetical protein
MARIMLSVPNEKPWSYGGHLEAALRELGHEVFLMDFRGVDDPNERARRVAAEFQPVVHVVWKGEVYAPETLRQIRGQGAFNVLWHPDAALPDWVPPLAAASDLFCIQSRGMFETCRRAGIERPEWLMEGLTPSCFAIDESTDEDAERYACDVVTVGTVDRLPGYRRRLHALDRLRRAGIDARWWGRRVALRLNPPWVWLSPARRAWGGGMVWGPSYAKVCRYARIFLTWPLFPDVSGGLSNRAFIATGLGAFYLSGYRRGMEEFFELGREVVVFHCEDEMIEQVRYYLRHEDERRAIATAGQARTLASYTNHHAFRRLFRMIAARGGPVV